MFWFAFASLSPAVLLALACLLGGAWCAVAVLWVTVVVFFVDKLPRVAPASQGAGHGVSLVLVAAHFILLPLGLWALSGDTLDALHKVLLFTGLGIFFGQISNSNAHELIHASPRALRRLGAVIYTSLLHGHHVSAHLRVHHVHACTDRDPNSARAGEGFWRYALRATKGEFIAGLRAENAHRARKSGASSLSHPYLFYVLGGVAFLTLSVITLSPQGLLMYIGLAAYAQFQLLLSDYVQHYGLRRQTQANGKPEPVGPAHSWNAPAWYSSAMMLNAPRHSDHHMRPGAPYPALRLEADSMPMLPHSLPVMAVVALIPPVWRRVMDERVAHWQNPA